MDGVAITDEHFNNMVIAPSIDAIEEFNIAKTSYAPEFGGKSGAVINVVSRSGSNNLHGSLFEFVRNDIFNAKNFFDAAAAPIPPFRQTNSAVAPADPSARTRHFSSELRSPAHPQIAHANIFRPHRRHVPVLFPINMIFDPNNNRQPFLNNQIPTSV